MKDFTFDAYRLYLKAIQTTYHPILRFDEYFRLEMKPVSFAMIRHDVDRRPYRALQMARLESEMGIRSTYYFRVKPHVFNPSIIRAIRRMGHEIGYHYETLSDAAGDHTCAMRWFGKNLKNMRKYSRIDTIAMHGRPFNPHNNLDLWRNPPARSRLINHFKLLGETYLDIDYRDIAYISDTGRNWDQKQANKRDFVDTNIPVSLKNGIELLQELKIKRWPKVVFQIHPERWSENTTGYFFQYFSDVCINLVKKML